MGERGALALAAKLKQLNILWISKQRRNSGNNPVGDAGVEAVCSLPLLKSLLMGKRPVIKTTPTSPCKHFRQSARSRHSNGSALVPR